MARIDNTPGPLPSAPIKSTQLAPTGPTKPVPPLGRDGLKLSGGAKAAANEPLPFDTTDLTAEEIGFIKQRLLPTNYADLKASLKMEGRAAATQLARTGMSGPFSPGFGDPVTMLDGARRTVQHPELLRLAQDVRKGDLLVITWNNPNDFIGGFTKGPFSHVTVCTSDGPPPEFAEAIGVTGQSNDPDSNKVRRVSWAEYAYEGVTTRIVRPTEGMPEPARSQAVDNAVRFAENQLGKPYNYTFTDIQDGTKATDEYYCSELAYLAYASPEGAHLNLPISKSADRDQMMVAAEALVDALKPINKRELMDRVCKEINRNPRPTEGELVAFFIDEVMVNCLATQKIASTPANRERLEQTIDSILQGKAFPHFAAGNEAYRAAQARGDFNSPFIGFFRREKAQLAIDAGFTRDATMLVMGSGANVFEATRAFADLVGAVLPYSQTISSYLYGPKDLKTKDLGILLDDLYAVKTHAPHLPLVGSFGLDRLPTRAKPAIKTDFVSPTDLAWAELPHHDYNLKRGHPLDPQPASTSSN